MSYETWLEVLCSGGGGVVTDPPPVFTNNPSDQCIDTQTDVCFECDGGTVTGYRWRVNGGVWTTVT